MSNYTTELRHICGMLSGRDPDLDNYRDVIEESLPKIFNFDFPIFDEDHRQYLERKIVKHYYFREIGCETFGQWRMRLDTKLNEIMPYYNDMYKSFEYLREPLTDVDYKRIITGTTGEQREEKNTSDQNTTNVNTGTVEDKSTGSVNNNRENMDAFSDTPQGTLDNVRNGKYLSSAKMTNTLDNTTSSDNSTRTNNLKGTSETSGHFNTEENTKGQHETVESVKGRMSTVSISKAVQEYRSAIINVDMQIINELNTLFMLVY